MLRDLFRLCDIEMGRKRIGQVNSAVVPSSAYSNEAIRFYDGCMLPPKKPSLGVEINEDEMTLPSHRLFC